MMLSVLLLLQLVSRTQAGVYGYVSSYTTKDFQGAGYQVVRDDKFSFDSFKQFYWWFCGGVCGKLGNVYSIEEVSGEGCQAERELIYNNSTFSSAAHTWSGANWTYNRNGIVQWTSLIFFELRNRSDIGKPNSSPQTTIRPTVRVPSNCQRNISLLTFDPDGDNIQCRYPRGSLSECITCTAAPVLSVFPSCTLSFNPTNSSNEGPYAVQLMMEDFPRQTMTLADSKGTKTVKTPSNPISAIPVQFIFTVDPAAPSCTEGLYLPRFLPPTPTNGALIYTFATETVEITIRAEATQSVITEIFFSGPYNVVKSSSGSGNFTLRWTPSLTQVGESHPICFIVQASFNSSVYESELRCVVVIIKNVYVFYLRMKIATTLSMENQEIIENALKDELVRRGMPSIIRLELLGNDLVKVVTIAPSSG